MFDDQTNNPAGGPPKNLPIEPEDMFAGIDNRPATAAAPPAPATPNALNAGVLKPVAPSAPAPVRPPVSTPSSTPAPTPPPAPVRPAITPVSATPSPVPTTAPGAAPTAPVYAMKEPILGKVILVVVLGAMLGGLGFGGWWVYNYMQSGGQLPTAGTIVPENEATLENEPVAAPPVTEDNIIAPVTENQNDVPAQMNNDKILFGEPIDTDKDGLDDVREQELGTDPNKTDSDSDGLTDGDEVLIWKTNPLSQDSDNDTYLDGDEVRHGYNPLGPGKLFNAPNGEETTNTGK